jgi:hypothetical protein
LWLEGVAGLGVVLCSWPTADGRVRRASALVIVFVAGTLLSILKTGGSAHHYLIQLVPLWALLAAVFYDRILSSRLRWPALVLAGLVAGVAMRPTASQYRVMVSRALAGEELRYGRAYEIAAYLKRENKANRQIFMLTDHITYWFIGQYPPTRWVHPSNMAKPYILEALVGKDASTETELRKILSNKPEFIGGDRIGYVDRHSGARRVLEETLASEFVLVANFEGLKLYRRK